MKTRFCTVHAVLLAALTLFTATPRAPAQTVWTNALSFDGVNDYVDLPDAVWFNGDFTVEAWVKLHAVKNFSRVADFSNGQSTNAVDFVLSDGTQLSDRRAPRLTRTLTPWVTARSSIAWAWVTDSSTQKGTKGTKR